MTLQEIKERLHRFNLTNDWSLISDVPPEDAIFVMYPSVMRMPGSSDAEYKKTLVELFGPLPEDA